MVELQLGVQTKGMNEKVEKKGRGRSRKLGLDIALDQASTYQQTSSPSSTPTKGSKQPWRQPKTVREFASQVNAVATRVLNEEIDMEKARTYVALTRVVAQTLSTEVTRSRFLKRAPDLTIDDPMVED